MFINNKTKLIVRTQWFDPFVLHAFYTDLSEIWHISRSLALSDNVDSTVLLFYSEIYLLNILTIFDCAGPIAKFLDWKFWSPISRLTYTLYLVHVLVIYWYIAVQESPMHFSYVHYVYFYFGKYMQLITNCTLGCWWKTNLSVSWKMKVRYTLVFRVDLLWCSNAYSKMLRLNHA